jgi:hypothetical protein
LIPLPSSVLHGEGDEVAVRRPDLLIDNDEDGSGIT